MKKFMLLAATAALFAACSSEDDFEQTGPTQAETNFTTGTDPVGFEAVTGKANTRATYGAITTDVLKTSSDGFGIFGYHGTAYSSSLKPNFMYNQQVIYSGSAWTYDPIKYWPNETGTGAQSTGVEKLSFFAYAPYIKVTPADGTPVAYTAKALKTGEAAQGITKITDNNDNGDPTITFVVPDDPAKQTDLLWGVIPSTYNWNSVEAAASAATTAGKPWIDFLKPEVNQKVKFKFNHALAKFNFLIDAYVDGDDNNTPVAPKTKIYVRKVEVTGKLAYEGKLNLNNTTANTPLWTKTGGTAFATGDEGTYTLNDGLKNDKEVSWITTTSGAEATTPFTVTTTEKVNESIGDGDGELATNHAAYTKTTIVTYTYDGETKTWSTSSTSTTNYHATAFESSQTGTTVSYGSGVAVANFVDPAESGVLNGTIIQGGSGVTNTPVNLLKGGDDTSIMLIPTGFEGKPTIKITYDVETTDSNLAGTLTNPLANGSVIENVIEKVLDGISKIDAGKEYTIRIHLGMTSVKVDAEVTDWTPQSEDVHLPQNEVVTP